ncbi:MAG: hypothetical protein HBSIN02_24760 [Bacteroidia bacterium]|nr:MAG: hypothetical protein HBSIN02_24760 [Bacteroidia bacterium]
MTTSEEINSTPNGAQFRRADLHIHSFGPKGSSDVKDNGMTPLAIVESSLKLGLSVISITDHNSIGNVEEAISHASGKPILVIPGIEVATTQGHLLCYFPTFAKLEQFYGKLELSTDRMICSQGFVQCLDLAEKYSGFGVAAHIETEASFEFMIPKYGPQKEAVLNHPKLLGIEVLKKENLDWYSDKDDNLERKRLFELRRFALGREDGYTIAKVMSSDAHSLAALGTNASGNKRLSRLKMDDLSFDAFGIAFLDPASRVRIEEVLPAFVPRFIGIKLDGGFLDGTVLKFNSNLTCIIGGRGTGTSTLLESIRAVSGNPSDSSLIDSEVWPDNITLLFEDEAGRQQTFTRPKSEDVYNVTDPVNGIQQIPIECYGQGETAAKIQNCDKDPAILLSFLDEFTDVDGLRAEESNLRERLIENQTIIETLGLEVKTIADVQKMKSNAEDKIRLLKEQKVSDIVKFEESLANGREFRESLSRDLATLVKNIKASLADRSLFNRVIALDDSTLVVGKEEFTKIKGLVSGFSDSIESVSGKLVSDTDQVIDKLKVLLADWKSKETGLLERIETKRKELEAQGVSCDLAFIKKVTRDAALYTRRLEDLKSKQTRLAEAQGARKTLLQQRRDLKSRIFQTRQAWASSVNQILKETVIDYQVTVKFSEGRYSSELQQFLKDTMSWRTSQVPKATLVSNAMSPFDLLDAIFTKSTAMLEAVVDEKGSRVFTRAAATEILDLLRVTEHQHRLQSLPFEDLPQITVTKFVEGSGGTRLPVVRDFTRLSLGQQQSILLSILLYSKSKYPLLIDQPEDNLDSEFIYRTIVRNLKRIKEFRQIIIVTHNANIAVLGDTELLIPLKSSSDKGRIVSRGSIDNSETKAITCDVLEGSAQAFTRRKEIYGL